MADDKKKKITEELLDDDFFGPPEEESEELSPEEEEIEIEEDTVEGEGTEWEGGAVPGEEKDSGISLEDFGDFFESPESEEAGAKTQTVSVDDLSLLEKEILKEEKTPHKPSGAETREEETLSFEPPTVAGKRSEPAIKAQEDLQEKKVTTPRAVKTVPEIVEVKTRSTGAILGALIAGLIIGGGAVYALSFLGIIPYPSKAPGITKTEMAKAPAPSPKPVPPSPPPAKPVAEKPLPSVEENAGTKPPEEKPASSPAKAEEKPQVTVTPPVHQTAVQERPQAPEPVPAKEPTRKKVASVNLPKKAPPPPPPPAPKFKIVVKDMSLAEKNKLVRIARSIGIPADVSTTTITRDSYIVVSDEVFPNMGRANAAALKANVLAGVKKTDIEKSPGGFVLIFGTFTSLKSAVSLKNKLSSSGIKAKIDVRSSKITLYNADVGKFPTREEADKVLKRLLSAGIKGEISSM